MKVDLTRDGNNVVARWDQYELILSLMGDMTRQVAIKQNNEVMAVFDGFAPGEGEAFMVGYLLGE